MVKQSEGTAQEESLVLTVEQVAKLLHVGRNTAYAAVTTGQIPAIKIGRRVLVPRAALERMLAAAGFDG